MTKSSVLHKLQEIDTTWQRVRQRLLTLQKSAGGSSKLQDARARVAEIEEKLQEWQTEQKDAELESRTLQQKIDESEERLMGGKVRNPKELEALQSNIESLKRQKSKVEDRGVEALMQVEELSSKLDQQRAAVSDIDADWQQEQEELEEEIEQRKKEYVYLRKLREQTADRLEDSLLDQYERLRERKNGVAVAKLEKDACGACYIKLPTSVVSTVRRDDSSLNRCPGCGRILSA